VNFAFSDEQEEIRTMLRGFLTDRAALEDVRRTMRLPHGIDPVLWRALSDELGLQGLIIPSEFGGTGLGPVDLCVVMEELGRSLACVPFLSTVALATPALLRLADSDFQREWLPKIASGDLIATLAVLETSSPADASPGSLPGGWDATGITMYASSDGNDYRLSGTKDFVSDGASAELILVVARDEHGSGEFGVFAVTGDAEGLVRKTLPALDETRPHARLEFQNTHATRLGASVAWSEIQAVLDFGIAALVAEQVGAMERALEMAVAYAKVREQFGRPVGSFQAIKHKCADMLMRVEAARAAAYYAGWAASEAGLTPSKADAELRTVASIAKADVSEAFVFVAEQNLQVHGGLGFTWEQDPHLFLKRARSSHVLLGDPDYHRTLSAAEFFS
jgi:alkylation response protein AidB-like acyl-CoA dehydrogenase